MRNVDLVKIHIVSPRNVWVNEERDFTRWLAENKRAIRVNRSPS